MAEFEPFDPIDDAIARQLAEVNAGAELRDGIVRGFRRRQRRQFVVMLAGCVVLAVLFGGSRMLRESGPVQVTAADWQKQATRFIQSDFNLARFQPDAAELQRFYSGIEPGGKLKLPGQLAGDEPIGCVEVELDGVNALLVCYYFPSGEQMHLFVTRPEVFREELADRPVFTPSGEWMSAAWTQNGLAYIAVAQGDTARLLELLAIHRVFLGRGILAS